MLLIRNECRAYPAIPRFISRFQVQSLFIILPNQASRDSRLNGGRGGGGELLPLLCLSLLRIGSSERNGCKRRESLNISCSSDKKRAWEVLRIGWNRGWSLVPEVVIRTCVSFTETLAAPQHVFDSVIRFVIYRGIRTIFILASGHGRNQIDKREKWIVPTFFLSPFSFTSYLFFSFFYLLCVLSFLVRSAVLIDLGSASGEVNFLISNVTLGSVLVVLSAFRTGNTQRVYHFGRRAPTKSKKLFSFPIFFTLTR